jgi:hypothetical protein
MKTRTKCLIGIAALIPLTLMADGVLTEQDAESSSNAPESEEFRMVDLVPTRSAGFANSFHTVPALPH